MQADYTAVPTDHVVRESFAERLWRRVSKAEGGCWEWQGSLTRGYGQIEFRREGKRQNSKAHRAAFELLRGPIPIGLHLDHLCRNTKCVNPDHLEPVSSAENTRRGLAGKYMRARQMAKAHCPQGHRYSETEYRAPKTGYRHCKACALEATRKWRLRNPRKGRAHA